MQRKPHLLPHDTWDKCQAPYDPELDKQKKKKNMDDTELKRINLFDHNAKKTPTVLCKAVTLNDTFYFHR